MIFKSFTGPDQIIEVERVINLLLDYAEEHFIVEELLLEAIGSNNSHIQQHKDFSRNFNHLRLQFSQKKDIAMASKVLSDVSDYLRKWILSHIAIYDINYVIQVFRNPEKETIIKKWAEKLKEKNLLVITRNQIDFYNSVLSKVTF